jgi:FkbH-like protein
MQTDSQRQELRAGIKQRVASQDAAGALTAARTLLASSQKHSDVIFCASWLLKLGDSLQNQLGFRRLKTYVVRSVTLEPMLPFLTIEGLFNGYILDFQFGAYGSYVDDLLNPGSELAAAKPDLVLLILDMEELAGQLPELCADGRNPDVDGEIDNCVQLLSQLLRTFRSNSSARVLVQGLASADSTALGDIGEANLPFSLAAAIERLNRRIAAVCSSIADCIYFDVDRVAARYGRSRWRDARMYFGSRLAVSPEFFSIYAENIVRSISPLFRATRKVLCTDLDNTLWGGVLGEEGPLGIITGSSFPGNCYLEYQRYLKQLSARGILLAIVSKNNEADVREAFRARRADLALQLEDFVATKISWKEKVESLRELARELSLGLDSFVFVDDNPMECEAIRQALPEVEVMAAPVDEPWKLTSFLTYKPFFDTAVVTGEDLNRVQDYKAQAKRANLEQQFPNRGEFLASMGIVCTFGSALTAPLDRSVQLLSKTNQFNLTTRRRSAAEIEDFASAPGGIAVAVRSRDRFGDAGVIGLALARQHGDACVIDSLLLSCRVIGRGIETAVLAYIARQAVHDGATRLIGEFIPTKKNAPCASFYPEHGFTQSSPAGSTPVLYELDLTTSLPSSPDWITLEGNESHELSASTAISS